jgi:hypothetical protein
MSNFKKLTLVGIIAAGVGSLMGCFPSQTDPSGNAGSTTIGMRVAVPKMATVTAKTSVISLNKLLITLTSNAGDTIRDTITSSTFPALNTSVGTNQTVAKYYTLKSLRTWKLVAQTRDLKDSVIHKDSATTGVLLMGDTTIISLSMSSKYVMYQANFINIPDSLQSISSGQKVAVHIYELRMDIDSITRADTTHVYFTGSQNLYYDYVHLGPRLVELYMFGHLEGGVDGLLFRGSVSITPGGSDSTVTDTLEYVGPSGVNGTGFAVVTIGKVVRITINGITPIPVLQ